MVVRKTFLPRALLLLVAALLLLLPAALGRAAVQPPGPETPSPISQTASLQGDVNCSGAVDAIDALLVLRSVAGLSSGDCIDSAANVDCSSATDAVDALRILRHVAALPLTAPEGCSPIGAPLGPPPSSFDLIEGALAAGGITLEQGTLYKAFALFNDPRLPSQFAGGGVSNEDSVMLEIASEYEDLSPEARAILDPFFLPPTAPGSWFEQRQALPQANTVLSAAASPSPCFGNLGQCWHIIDTANGKARVWWQDRFPEDEAMAQAIADAIDSDIWSKLASLLGREPLPDDRNPDTSDPLPEELTGYSPRLDIHIVDELGSPAENIMYVKSGKRSVCNDSPTYILVRRVIFDDPVSVTAHEIMHAFQAAFTTFESCSQSLWTREATAVWSEDYVFPNANREHGYAVDYFEPIGESLTSMLTDRREYGSYIFFQFLQRKLGASFMQQLWNAMIDDYTVPILDSLLPGGYAQAWPEFVRYAWNRQPVAQFQQWDGLEGGAVPRLLQATDAPGSGGTYRPGVIDVSLGGGQSEVRLESQGSQVPWLSAHYYHFRFNDPGIRYVEANNPFSPNVPATASVQALIKIDGQWAVEDWTSTAKKTFCLQEEEEALQELVIIVSNDTRYNMGADTLPAFTNPLVVASDACKGWAGSMTYRRRITTTPSPGGVTTAVNSEQTFTATDLVFLRSEGGESGMEHYELKSGRVQWSTSGVVRTYANGQVVGECAFSGSGIVQLAPGDAAIDIDADGEAAWTYYITGATEKKVTVDWCDGPQQGPLGIWFVMSDEGHSAPRGDTLQGAYDSGGDNSTWNLTAIQADLP